MAQEANWSFTILLSRVAWPEDSAQERAEHRHDQPGWIRVSAPVCSLIAEVGPGRRAFSVYSHSFKVSNTRWAQLCGAVRVRSSPPSSPSPKAARMG